MFVSLGDLPRAFQLLVVLILDADGAADVVDDVLIGRRVVAARSFVADAVGRLPIGVDVAAGHRRTGLGVLRVLLEKLATPRARR
jgi:hypothetical protein